MSSSSTLATQARDVRERFRQAAIARSADDMSSVYAIDAVHESDPEAGI
jgi:hypothetical protein